MKKSKIIAIIPARGGSKGLPKKNTRALAGKPLIAWSIEQALKSKYIDTLIVNTDSEEIAGIAKKYGAEVPFLRPKKLAQDKSSIYDVIFHTLDWFKKNGSEFDIVILLEPTSPLRKKDDIDNAIKLFLKNRKQADSLVSVGEIHLENPSISLKINKKYVTPYMKTDFSMRQELAKVYFPYGVIYLSKVKMLEKHKKFYQKRTIPYSIERWQNYEIDDIYDFVCIEAVLNIKLKEKQI
ncbi:acylneuraminate cytidylyltransferase family protein [Candidatus Parcubacteria bacterium]|nr:acylneuraminate cytidylyltransferase family protein [Candidatus Parcubacteria bacterium]